jgi:AAA domain
MTGVTLGWPALKTTAGYVDASDFDDVSNEWLPVESTDGVRAASDKKAIKANLFGLGDPRAIPPREWLYGRHYARRFVSGTVGIGGGGKSSLVAVEAVAMASMKCLLGTVVPPKALRVWYYNLEDPLDELQRRFAAICLHYKITAEDLGDRLFLSSGRDSELVIAYDERGSFKTATPTVDALNEEIKNKQIDVLIVDPFVGAHGVSENDNGKINAVFRQWRMIAEANNCAVELVHHTRKGQFGQGEITVDDTRGAGAFSAATRSLRVLNTMTKEEARKAGVENHRSHFRVDNGKNNFAAPAESSSWHRIVGVHLGNGERGGDSVGVVTAWDWPDASEQITPEDVCEVQAAVAAGEWREDVRASNWVGKTIAEALKLDLMEPSAKVTVKGLLKSWLKDGTLKTR